MLLPDHLHVLRASAAPFPMTYSCLLLLLAVLAPPPCAAQLSRYMLCTVTNAACSDALLARVQGQAHHQGAP